MSRKKRYSLRKSIGHLRATERVRRRYITNNLVWLLTRTERPPRNCPLSLARRRCADSRNFGPPASHQFVRNLQCRAARSDTNPQSQPLMYGGERFCGQRQTPVDFNSTKWSHHAEKNDGCRRGGYWPLRTHLSLKRWGSTDKIKGHGHFNSSTVFSMDCRYSRIRIESCSGVR